MTGPDTRLDPVPGDRMVINGWPAGAVPARVSSLIGDKR
jgi:hypothetical protein